jgi:hypothetical protein
VRIGCPRSAQAHSCLNLQVNDPDPIFEPQDRDGEYTHSFDAVFKADDVEILISPPQPVRHTV